MESSDFGFGYDNSFPILSDKSSMDIYLKNNNLEAQTHERNTYDDDYTSSSGNNQEFKMEVDYPDNLFKQGNTCFPQNQYVNEFHMESTHNYTNGPSDLTDQYESYSTKIEQKTGKEMSPNSELSMFQPKIKPRSYKKRSESEKKNPTYILKREKNNDAVRQCRAKAKVRQQQADKNTERLKQRVVELEELLKRNESETRVWDYQATTSQNSYHVWERQF
ncbi:unnamed protein product [Caenorhabditis angaria]|uniref:BZIP domain-containing protein n=1 Tax=Caenorhabditis angaria TaxID=860376 RepID=A0A9P1J4Q9_9PELO|nr:unnamed protein product [Caenorhabditis angaria]